MIADLVQQIRGEQVLAALADENPRLTIERLVRDAVARSMLVGTRLRVDARFLPQWWRNEVDPTQIDGLIVYAGRAGSLGSLTEASLALLSFEIPSGPTFTVQFSQFVSALRLGMVTDG